MSATYEFFGLDIGSYWIKGVQLHPNKEGTFSLVSFGVIPSPVNLALSDHEGDLRTMSEGLKELVRAYKLPPAVVTTLPEGLLFSFVIDFPRMSEKELAKSLQWEAEQYLPMPLEEVSLDYTILEPTGRLKNQERMEVAFIAAPKKLVNKYLRVIEQAGLEVLAVENQTTAVVRSLAVGAVDTPTTIYISLGALATDFAIVRTGAVRFTRSIPTGGGVMTRAVAEKLGFDSQRAEEYKKSQGVTEEGVEGKMREALAPVVDLLVSEVRRAMTFYASRYHPDSIKRAVLFGGSALLPGLLPYLAGHLDLEIELANSTRLITYPPESSSLKEQFIQLSPITTVAIGLAMKRIA